MRTAFSILDFREETGTVVVVSAGRNVPQDESDYPYLWNGLQDCTGRGDVTLKCFRGQVQLGHSTRQLQEAGSNPVTTLLNGAVKQHYMDSLVSMSGISSLGWSKFDVLFYGFAGTAGIDGGQSQTCASPDYSKVINRTTFVPGTNYLKFADLEASFRAKTEGLNVSPGPQVKKPASAMTWTGSSARLVE